jgi:hypothetical protein
MEPQTRSLSPLIPTFNDSGDLQYASTPMPETPQLPFSLPLDPPILLGPNRLRLNPTPSYPVREWSDSSYSPYTTAPPSSGFLSPRLAPDRNFILSLSVSDLLIHPFCSKLHSQVEGALNEIMKLNTEVRSLQNTIATL